MKRFLFFFVAAIVALELAYIVTINVFLASATGQALISSHPEIVAVHFKSIRSWYPLNLAVENLDFRYQDQAVQMQLTADKARMDLNLFTLLSKRTVTGSRIRAEGVTLRIRERKYQNEYLAGEITKYPPIDGWETPVLREKRAPPPDDAHYDLVSVDLRDIDGRNIREIWVDDYRFQGSVDVSGGFYYKPLRKIRLDTVKVGVARGDLTFGKETVCKDVMLQLSVNVPELDVHDFRQNALRVMDAALKLETVVPDATFVNFYLKDVPEVRLADGAGKISVLLDIKHGQIIPGSKATMDTTKMRVNIPELAITGKGSIRWLARAKDAWLDVKVRDIALTQLRSGKVRMKGPQFNVSAVTTGLDLSKPMNLVLVLDLPEAQAEDLSFLSDYIPKGTGVAVKGGKGIVSGNLEIDAAKQKARGSLKIDGEKVTVTTRGASMRGYVQVRGNVDAIDLRTGAVDFGGSTLALNDVHVDAEGRSFDHFWLKVEAPQFRLSAAKDIKQMKWFARVKVGFQSLLPIMSVVSANVPIPWVLKAFSDLRDVHVNATVRVHPGGVELPLLAAQSGILHVDGDMHLREKNDTYEPYGNLLVKVGAIPVGVSLEGKSARPVLVGAESWFTRQRIKWEQDGAP